MKLVQISLLLSVVLFATGCPQTRTPMPSAIKDKLIARETDKLVALADGYDAAIKSGTKADLDKAQFYRNELMHLGLLLVDDNYNQFENDLFVKRASTNVAADITELGLAAATGITNGERVKTILAIALTAFKGGRKSIDVNFFRERSTELIALKMRASRARALEVIYRGLASPVDKYPLGAGLDDLINYLYAGSLNSALLELAQDTGEDAKAARKSTRDFKISSFLTEAQVKTFADIRDAREDLRLKLFNADPAISGPATTKIKAILAKLGYTPAQIGAATTPNALFELLQDKIEEATEKSDHDTLNKIDAMLSAP